MIFHLRFFLIWLYGYSTIANNHIADMKYLSSKDRKYGKTGKKHMCFAPDKRLYSIIRI